MRENDNENDNEGQNGTDLIDDENDDKTNNNNTGEFNRNKKNDIINTEKKNSHKSEEDILKIKILQNEVKPKEHVVDNLNLEHNITEKPKKFKIPSTLKKTFIVTMILAILGVGLIICGFIKAVAEHTPGGGLMFWILGGVVLIPGGYYSYQFCKAKRAKQDYIRQDILDNIPQL